jgi:hypothetical protein
MILVDAHVHIYDCFDLEKFLDAAYSNFQAEANRQCYGNKFTPILLLAETAENCWFDRLREYADGRNIHKYRTKQKWGFHPTNENVSLTARSGNSKGLIIVAGRQVETAEGLEVLALSTIGSFESGIPIIDLIKEVKKKDAIPVIPWGFGKWIGGRGDLLKNLLASTEEQAFLLGDNGGRPFLLPAPHIFRLAEKKGIKILPGSDPLPLASEQKRVGSFGLSFHGAISNKHPAQDLKQFLMNPMTEFETFGRLENTIQFLWNQLALRFKRAC